MRLFSKPNLPPRQVKFTTKVNFPPVQNPCSTGSSQVSVALTSLSLLSYFLQHTWQGLSTFFSSTTLRYQLILGYIFLSDNNGTYKLASRGTLLQPFTYPCRFSLLTSHIHSSLPLHWKSTVSSKFSTYTFLQFPLKN